MPWVTGSPVPVASTSTRAAGVAGVSGVQRSPISQGSSLRAPAMVVWRPYVCDPAQEAHESESAKGSDRANDAARTLETGTQVRDMGGGASHIARAAGACARTTLHDL